MQVLRFAETISLLLILCSSTIGQQSRDSRPNFVFIIADDMAQASLDCYGDQTCETPNLDRLATSGIVIDDAHHMGAHIGGVCTPSRTMIMTGRALWKLPRTGPDPVTKEQLNRERRLLSTTSLPAVFNEAGYETFRTCKIGNSFEEANRLFKHRKDATKRGGTDEDGSAWHADQVLNFLENYQQTQDSSPFLIYLGFSHPHDPRHPLPELAAKYGSLGDHVPQQTNEKMPPLPPQYLPQHPFPHGHPGLRDEELVEGILTRRDETAIRYELGREAACIENIDQQIGRVLDRLDELQLTENTYIIFTSDHGIAVGRHGLLGKQNLYEHTWKVPMLVSGPGIKRGSRASGFIYLMDVLPTLCDLAGINAPADVDGRSFRPVLEGQTDRIRDVMYGVYCGGTKPGIRAVKMGDWKLIEYDVLDGTVQRTQLFNLRSNPLELLTEHHAGEIIAVTSHHPQLDQMNLAGNSEHTERLTQMRRALVDQMQAYEDPYQLRQLEP